MAKVYNPLKKKQILLRQNKTDILINRFNSIQETTHKRAFSLIKLLIVIVIIGSIYTLAINNFNKLNDNTKNLNISNLKTYLLSLP